jgi:uncharacterized protein (DUF2249 family)
MLTRSPKRLAPGQISHRLYTGCSPFCTIACFHTSWRRSPGSAQPSFDLLISDHQRLRADVENLESSRTRSLTGIAAAALVTRLDRHVRREECWVEDACSGAKSGVDVEDWDLLMRLSDVIDVDSLPAVCRDDLVLRRLLAMRCGETLRLHATRNLHDLWRRQQAVDPGSHAWVYGQDGPTRWDVRITRRDRGAC